MNGPARLLVLAIVTAVCLPATAPAADADCRPLVCADYTRGNAVVSWFEVIRTDEASENHNFYAMPAVSGTTIWVAAGTHLVAYDASDPRQPRRLASLPLASGATFVTIEGDLAFVTGSLGLSIVDIANPAAPSVVRAIGQPRFLHVSTYRDGFLFVAGDNYIHRIDVRYPPHPVVVENYYTVHQVRDLAIHGDQLVVADSERISGLEIDDPDGLTIAWRIPGMIRELAVDGDYLYAADWRELAIYRFDTSAVAPVRVAAHAMQGSRWVKPIGDRLYVDDSEGIRIFDATDPAGLLELAGLPGTKSVSSPAALGELLASEMNLSQIQIYDPRRAVVPPAAGRVALPAATWPQALATDGTRAFVSYGIDRDLAALDLRDPLRPRLVGQLPRLRYPADCLSLQGDLLYVNGLQCFDVSDPAQPRVVNEEVVGGRFVIDGQVAFVAGGPAAADYRVLCAMDIRDPAHPVEIGRLELGGDLSMYALMVLEGHRLVVSNGGRLAVVDVADPRAMRRIASIAVSTAACRGLDVEGDLVFFQGDRSELHILDLANPALPRRRSIFRPPTSLTTSGVLAGHGVAYLAWGEYGLLILDVSDPDRPELIGNVGAPGLSGPSVGRAALTADRIVIVSNDGQVKVTPRQCGDVVATVTAGIEIEPKDRCHRVPCGPRARGRIEVAILSGKGFAAAEVEPGSLRFGPGDAAPLRRPAGPDGGGDARPGRGHPGRDHGLRDIDCDGDLDLLVTFDAGEAGFACGDTIGGITGTRADGSRFCGAAPVVTSRACPAADSRVLDVAGAKSRHPDRDCGEKGLDPLDGDAVAARFSLAPVAAPNPFNPGTAITFTLAVPCRLDVAVYDLAGRRLAELGTGTFAPGEHRLAWPGTDSRGASAPSGIYLARIVGDGIDVTLRLALLR